VGEAILKGFRDLNRRNGGAIATATVAGRNLGWKFERFEGRCGGVDGE